MEQGQSWKQARPLSGSQGELCEPTNQIIFHFYKHWHQLLSDRKECSRGGRHIKTYMRGFWYHTDLEDMCSKIKNT